MVKTIALVMCICGIALVAKPQFLPFLDPEWDESAEYPDMTEGYITAIVGSMFTTASLASIRVAKGAGSLQLMLSYCVFSGAVSAIMMVTFQGGVAPSAAGWGWSLLVPALGHICHYGVHVGCALLPPGAASMYVSTDMVWAYVLQWALGDELGIFFSSRSIFDFNCCFSDRFREVFFSKESKVIFYDF